MGHDSPGVLLRLYHDMILELLVDVVTWYTLLAAGVPRASMTCRFGVKPVYEF